MVVFAADARVNFTKLVYSNGNIFAYGIRLNLLIKYVAHGVRKLSEIALLI